jgi:hypothetical protein
VEVAADESQGELLTGLRRQVGVLKHPEGIAVDRSDIALEELGLSGLVGVVSPPARREYERPSGRDLAEVSIVQFCHARLTIPPRHRILTRTPEPPHSFYVTNSQWSEDEDLLWLFPPFFAVLRVPRAVLSDPSRPKPQTAQHQDWLFGLVSPALRCSALSPLAGAF